MNEKKYKKIVKRHIIAGIIYILGMIGFIIIMTNLDTVFDGPGMVIILPIELFWIISMIYTLVSANKIKKYKRMKTHFLVCEFRERVIQECEKYNIEYSELLNDKYRVKKIIFYVGALYIVGDIVIASICDLQLLEQLANMTYEEIQKDYSLSTELERCSNKINLDTGITIGKPSDVILWIDACEYVDDSTKPMSDSEYMTKSILYGEGYATKKYLDNRDKIIQNQMNKKYKVYVKLYNNEEFVAGPGELRGIGFYCKMLWDFFPEKCGLEVKSIVKKYLDLKGM